MHTYHEWLELFKQELVNIDAIQVAVLVLGVSEVFLARANNIWLYPTGIASVILAIFSLFKVGLYAECLLQGYYLVMSVYGWWYWSTKKNNVPVQVTFSTRLGMVHHARDHIWRVCHFVFIPYFFYRFRCACLGCLG